MNNSRPSSDMPSCCTWAALNVAKLETVVVRTLVEIEKNFASRDVEVSANARQSVAEASGGAGEFGQRAHVEATLRTILTGDIAIIARPPAGENAANTLAA